MISKIAYPRWWFQMFLIFTPDLGEMIQFDKHIFQIGVNHQLVFITPTNDRKSMGFTGVMAHPEISGVISPYLYLHLVWMAL